MLDSLKNILHVVNHKVSEYPLNEPINVTYDWYYN